LNFGLLILSEILSFSIEIDSICSSSIWFRVLLKVAKIKLSLAAVGPILFTSISDLGNPSYS